MSTPSSCPVAPRPFWGPLRAGLSLGAVLLLTFMLTGHGLGATGFTTRLTAWLAGGVAPAATQANSYLGPLLEDGHPLSAWITWQVLGVALGALLAAWRGARLRWQVDGSRSLGGPRRLAMALLGGVAAGWGARVSAGCTSGLGLSGAATLGLAAFAFLGAFFAAGLIVSRLVRGVQ
ncbi:YeeE/YedE thiosulfate transporter family protein [Ideonella dechloratans]|uniref:YeeE/YedE thiosulfate transporter family protein n=1 Tax=Ideonella dechloratans TaxID=36863 RepID=UPI0035AF9929